jgi:succinate-acetate transporter protein
VMNFTLKYTRGGFLFFFSLSVLFVCLKAWFDLGNRRPVFE